MYPISMKGFAEVSAAAPKAKSSRLKKYKFKKSGESKGRSNYYVKALAAIRHLHHGDTESMNKIIGELRQAGTTESDSRKRTKALHNLRAIADYTKHFGKRALNPLRGKRLYYVHEQLAVSAQPDLIAEEDGKTKLIKFNFGVKDLAGGVGGIMLHVLYQAANLKGLSLKSDQVECIQVSSGNRIIGPKNGFGSPASLQKMAQELILLWPTVN